MSSERDELAALADFLNMATYDEYGPTIDYDILLDIASRLVTAGYRKPTVVHTQDELEALPEGTLLLASGTYYGDGTFTDCHVRILPAFIHGEDRTVIEVLIYGGSDLAKSIDFPATVLHVGGTNA